jgi:integrase
VACWKLAWLPRGLTDEQFDRLLASFGRTTPCSRRNYAIVQCLATLGLRPVEVAGLCLEDIDWRAGTIHLRTRKTRRGALLPLPREAGRAIAEYLRKERPQSTARQVFLRHDSGRRGEAISSGIVTGVVRHALDRAGIDDAPIAGAYVLRHTVAIRLVRRGTGIKEVADFLGHQHLDTTAIYAKVDLEALREVALPWPEVTRS